MSFVTPSFHFWLLDVRNVWMGKSVNDVAPAALALLSPPERDKAEKFYFQKDAKLSIGASLLKRRFASRALGEPWHEARFIRREDRKHGKPAVELVSARSATGEDVQDVAHDFNVSHQAGLVALVGCCSFYSPASRSDRVSNRTADQPILVGVDITYVNERGKDTTVIAREGFAAFIDMHQEIFSPSDLQRMKEPLSPVDRASAPTADDTEVMLRRFYAFWALKEAYVKMTGEALLASWLRDVEFINVRVPSAFQNERQGWGEVVTGIKVVFKGETLDKVSMKLQAFENDYLIATAIGIGRTSELEVANAVVCRYEILDLEKDIYTSAS